MLFSDDSSIMEYLLYLLVLNTVALTKGEWRLTLIFDDYTLAFIAWTISSDAPVCFMIPLCSDRLGLLKVFVLVYHWTVPPLL